MRKLSLLGFLVLTTCGGSDDGTSAGEIPLKVDQRCPGDANCPDEGDGKLYAGAAKRVITPMLEPFTDTNGNGQWDDGEPYTDLNGNGMFDHIWIAGRNMGNEALTVHDDLWARAWVLRFNKTTIAFVSVDSLGMFGPDMEAAQAMLDPSLEVDLVVPSGTHDHEAPDLLGQWGPDTSTRGVNDAYLKFLQQQVADAITEAVHALKPAKMKAGSIQVMDAQGTDARYVSDTRDPLVIDNRMHVLQFDGADDNKPIVTVVNWAAHPDSFDSDHHALTADYVHYLREEAELGTGDDVVFVNGSVGGQVGSGRVEIPDSNGTMMPKKTFAFIEAWGRGIADFIPRALDASQGGDVIDDAAPKIQFKTSRFLVHVDNVAFQTGGAIGLFSRDFAYYDKHKPITPENTPQIETRVAYIQLGDHISIICTPGELVPELFIGGYDGSDTYGWGPVVDTTQANAADITKAPKPPYLRDLMDGDEKHRMNFGLSMDFLGYIVAKFNFVLAPVAPYINEADGDHYEETNSIGPRAEAEIVGTLKQLVQEGRKVTK